jgi:hypothetical protein
MVIYAKLAASIPIDSFKEEVNALHHQWVAHFNYMQYEGEWTALPLRSPGGKIDEAIPDAIRGDHYANTELLLVCPAIQSWLKQLNCPLQSVRLLKLKAGSIIKEHRDHELCFEQGEARLHIPIFTNEKVEFYINKVLVKMTEGNCYYLNANLPHSVANRGATDRIHLVVDCLVNDWLKSVFEEGEQYHSNTDASMQTRQVIRELRLQDTEISNRIADELEKTLRDDGPETTDHRRRTTDDGPQTMDH